MIPVAFTHLHAIFLTKQIELFLSILTCFLIDNVPNSESEMENKLNKTDLRSSYSLAQ